MDVSVVSPGHSTSHKLPIHCRRDISAGSGAESRGTGNAGDGSLELVIATSFDDGNSKPMLSETCANRDPGSPSPDHDVVKCGMEGSPCFESENAQEGHKDGRCRLSSTDGEEHWNDRE